MPEPIATWNPARGAWEKPETNILCGHSALYSETWPTSGMTRGGRSYPLPTQGHRTDASESSSLPSLLPTPRPQTKGGDSAPEAEVGGTRPSGTKRALNLATVTAHLLPTPQVAYDGRSQEAWREAKDRAAARHQAGEYAPGTGAPGMMDLQRAMTLLPTPQEFDSHFDSLNISPEAAEWQLHRTDGIRRSTTGSLTKDLLLLKTPTAQLATNGGSQHPDKRREGGHGPTLADQVEHQLLPTPRATDGTHGGPNQRGSSGDLMLPSAVIGLAPPADVASTSMTTGDSAPGLAEATAPTLNSAGPMADGTASRTTPTPPMSAPTLLPTPRASDTGTPGRRATEGFRPPLSQVLLPTPRAQDAKHAEPSQNELTRDLGKDLLHVRLARQASSGEPTGSLLPDGNRFSDGRPHVQLSLDGLESA